MERRAFLDAIAAALIAGGGALRVLLVVRSDFEPEIAPSGAPPDTAWAALAGEPWRAARLLMPPPTREDLRQIIEAPARKRALFFEPARLVDVLLDDVRGMPGVLPLLSVTLAGLYRASAERRDADRALRLEDYEAMGTVTGAIGHEADAVIALLDGDERDTMKRLLLRMVSERSDGVRRRVWWRELEYDDPAEEARIGRVVDLLEERRLLVRDADGDLAYVEAAHDALLTGWTQLKAWQKDAAEWLPLHRRLTEAALETERASREGVGLPPLYTGERLARTLALRRRDPRLLSRPEVRFLEQSRRQQRIRIGAIVAAAAIILGGLGYGIYEARDRAREAGERAVESEARAQVERARGMLKRDPHGAVAVALGAWQKRPTEQAGQVLRDAVVQDRLRGELAPGDGPLRAAVFSPSGARILLVGDEGLSVWDSTALASTGRIDTSGVDHALLSSDGAHVLALRGADGVAELWRLGQPAPSRTFPGAVQIHPGPGAGLRVVVEAAASGTVETSVHDAETGRRLVVVPGRFAAMASDGEWLAVARPEIVLVSIGASPRERPVRGVEGTPVCSGQALRWSSPRVGDDSCVLDDRDAEAVFLDHRSIALQEARGARAAVTVGPGAKEVIAIRHTVAMLAAPSAGSLDPLPHAIEARGALFAPEYGFATLHGTKILEWTPAIASPLPAATDLEAQRGAPLAASLGGFGGLLAVGSSDGAVTVWARIGEGPGAARLLASIPAHTGAVRSVVFHPGGEPLLLTAGDDGVARLWRVGGRLEPRPAGARLLRLVRSRSASIEAGALVVRRLDGGDAEIRAPLPEAWGAEEPRLALTDAPAGTVACAVAPSGDAFASWSVGERDRASVPRTVEWGGAQVKLVGVVPGPGSDRALVVLAAASEPAEIVLWDSAHGRGIAGVKLASHRGLSEGSAAVAWSPDGRRVALTAGKSPLLFDVEPWTETASCPAHVARVSKVAFRPDGRWLAAGDEYGEIRLCGTGAPASALLGHSARVSSLSWADDHRLLSASTAGDVRVWDARTGAEITAFWGAGGAVQDAILAPDRAHILALSRSGQTGQRQLVRFDFEGALEPRALAALARDRVSRWPVRD